MRNKALIVDKSDVIISGFKNKIIKIFLLNIKFEFLGIGISHKLVKLKI